MVYLTYFFSPAWYLEQSVFRERMEEGLDVFRVFCRGPECVNVECTKKKSHTHNTVDCDCDNGAIVAGLSIALCHPTGS